MAMKRKTIKVKLNVKGSGLNGKTLVGKALKKESETWQDFVYRIGIETLRPTTKFLIKTVGKLKGPEGKKTEVAELHEPMHVFLGKYNRKRLNHTVILMENNDADGNCVIALKEKSIPAKPKKSGKNKCTNRASVPKIPKAENPNKSGSRRPADSDSEDPNSTNGNLLMLENPSVPHIKTAEDDPAYNQDEAFNSVASELTVSNVISVPLKRESAATHPNQNAGAVSEDQIEVDSENLSGNILDIGNPANDGNGASADAIEENDGVGEANIDIGNIKFDAGEQNYDGAVMDNQILIDSDSDIEDVQQRADAIANVNIRSAVEEIEEAISKISNAESLLMRDENKELRKSQKWQECVRLLKHCTNNLNTMVENMDK